VHRGAVAVRGLAMKGRTQVETSPFTFQVKANEIRIKGGFLQSQRSSEKEKKANVSEAIHDNSLLCFLRIREVLCKTSFFFKDTVVAERVCFLEPP